jgi:hypothetical protein
MTQMNMINADNLKILFDHNYQRHQRSILGC